MAGRDRAARDKELGVKQHHRIVLEGHLGAHCKKPTVNPNVLRSGKAEAERDSRAQGVDMEKMGEKMGLLLEEKMVGIKKFKNVTSYKLVNFKLI